MKQWMFLGTLYAVKQNKHTQCTDHLLPEGYVQFCLCRLLLNVECDSLCISECMCLLVSMFCTTEYQEILGGEANALVPRGVFTCRQKANHCLDYYL